MRYGWQLEFTDLEHIKGNTEIEINAGLATILWLGLLITRRLPVTHPVSTPTFQFKLLGRMSQ
jgi:hypothetical protein